MTTFSLSALVEINYWAVLVAAVVAFALGGLWYSPVLLESVWMEANGYNAEQVQQMQSAARFAGALLSYMMLALVLAYLKVTFGVDKLSTGLVLAFLVWLGFVASTGLTVNLFSIRPLMTWLIDAGFQLCCLLITGAILSLWR